MLVSDFFDIYLKRFILLLLGMYVVFSPNVASASGRVALVIGNSAYVNSPLVNPRNDAQDISEALRKFGFEVTLLTDASTRQMRNAIRDFGSKSTRAEAALFYFAGHGLQIRGTNYLVPTQADIRTEADAEDLSVSASYVLRTMEDSEAKVKVVILDACRNNPYARSFRSAERGLASMQAATGTLIAFSTAPGSVASDGDGRNGLYTKHLLKSLDDANTDILKVFQRTRANVLKESSGQQVPWESTSLIGDFYFQRKLDDSPLALIETKINNNSASASSESQAVALSNPNPSVSKQNTSEENPGQQNLAAGRKFSSDWLGLRFVDLTEEEKRSSNTPIKVSISEVYGPNTKYWGLKAGDVVVEASQNKSLFQKQTIHAPNAERLAQELDKLDRQKIVVFTVFRGKGLLFIPVNPLIPPPKTP